MDTLKQYDRLRASGIPDAQARAQVGVMSDEMSGMAAWTNVMTKSDLAGAEARLNEWMDAKFAALRADIRGDIHKMAAVAAVGFAVIIARLFFGG